MAWARKFRRSERAEVHKGRMQNHATRVQHHVYVLFPYLQLMTGDVFVRGAWFARRGLAFSVPSILLPGSWVIIPMKFLQ
jgi:hypothetical protein